MFMNAIVVLALPPALYLHNSPFPFPYFSSNLMHNEIRTHSYPHRSINSSASHVQEQGAPVGCVSRFLFVHDLSFLSCNDFGVILISCFMLAISKCFTYSKNTSSHLPIALLILSLRRYSSTLSLRAPLMP
ncbi:hypothetical protein BDR05DRAFT_720129 [Suillus weaverae]|nr:hypothetical protein BDR05DRAFT_720129 [Suillus weaverae]